MCGDVATAVAISVSPPDVFRVWVNRHQLDVTEYLQEENRILKERLGGRRIRFTDVERCRLARKAQALGRKVLSELETVVTADTLLRWYRGLIVSKWNYSRRRGPGRPRMMTVVAHLMCEWRSSPRHAALRSVGDHRLLHCAFTDPILAWGLELQLNNIATGFAV